MKRLINNDERPAIEDIDPVERLQRLQRLFADVAEKLREWLKDRPPVIRCERHNVERRIDFEQSLRRTMMQTDYTAVYAPCPHCVREAAEAEANKWLLRFGVPESILHATTDNFHSHGPEDEKVLAALAAMCEKKKGIVIICGDPGVGKTHLAVGALRKFGSGLFVPATKLFGDYKAWLHDDLYRDPVGPVKSTRFLVMDDVPTEMSNADERLVRDVLFYRHAHKLPTVVTTNMRLSDFYNRIGGSMQDRLKEAGIKAAELHGLSARSQTRERYLMD